jgi:hypothetical protein
MNSLFEAVGDLFVGFNIGWVDGHWRTDNPLFEALINNDQSDSDMFIDMLSPHDIKMTRVARRGGANQGSEIWAVYKFVCGDETIYIKYEGFYSSYDGIEYHRCKEVFPKEVTTTIYVDGDTK